MAGWTKKRVLITVRTYPIPSKSSIEVSCTAGITDDGEWIRLFPIPYRFLDDDKRFKKYQLIEADVIKSESDQRSESFKINIDSINILGQPLQSNNKWEARKTRIFPLKANSLCFLQKELDAKQKPTLGLFKPQKITTLRIEQTSNEWSPSQLASLSQYPLFGNHPRTQLEKLPFDFSYEFKCEESDCKGHKLICTDWEMGWSYIKWREKYGMKWEQKFRETFETKMISANDTHFFVGTLHNYPDAWIIIGLFYPPK
jgi:hypothetical protein